jgi:uncharacterized membrane protein
MIFVVVVGVVLLVVSAVVIGFSMDTATRRERWRRVAEERRAEGEQRRAEHAQRWSQV